MDRETLAIGTVAAIMAREAMSSRVQANRLQLSRLPKLARTIEECVGADRPVVLLSAPVTGKRELASVVLPEVLREDLLQWSPDRYERAL